MGVNGDRKSLCPLLMACSLGQMHKISKKGETGHLFMLCAVHAEFLKPMEYSHRGDKGK